MSDRRRQHRPDPKPLFDEAAERAVVGICLHDQNEFWKAFGRVKPEHFTIPRLGRVWEAMARCGETRQPINQNRIPLMIKNDQGEETPIKIFLAVLFNDAPPASEADIYVDTVVELASKRALLDSLEKARHEIIDMDIGNSVEIMRDVAIRQISGAFHGERDDDMMDYEQWANQFVNRATQNLNEEEEGAAGYSPGLASVKEVIGNLLPGKLYVLAGMSSSGKSALARQIMEAVAREAYMRKHGSVYIASLEMTGEEYAIRSLAQELRLASNYLEQGRLNPSEVERIAIAARRMSRLPIIVDQRPRMTMENIRARALKVKNTRGLCAMALDHLLLIKGGPRDSMLDRVSDATIEAKNMAKEFGIPVIMLAQLNEGKIMESETKWPNSTHLFGGQTIMQNADVICFVHRPAIVHAKTEPPKDAKAKKEGDMTPWERWNFKMEEIREKAFVYNNKRRGGAGNTRAEMLFDGPTMTFSDLNA